MSEVNTALIDGYLQTMWDRHGTDVLLVAGAPPLMRHDGQITPLGDHPLRPEDTARTVRGVLAGELWDAFVAERELDFSFNWEGQARFRANAYHQRGSVALSLRLIPYRIPTFDELGLPPVMRGWVDLPQGLVLVTGPTGAGKSTTLAAMIDAVNRTRKCHIITIEDPIEYVHKHKAAAVSQREIGMDTDSFARALRSALREDPDVLLVGEMRDAETIQTALTIAETGHLVFATLHTNDAGQAIDRIVDVFAGEKQSQIRVQLAGSLTGIVSQRLMPRIGGGRVAAFEVLCATFAMRNLIREGKSSQLRNLVTTGGRYGMQTLEQSLSDLVLAGAIEYDEAISRSLFPADIARAAHLAGVQTA
ncbi:MAG: twitching motility protein PilT [Actinomycetia bacterium]|nr:twitching motility protein PilT [Actinomycetes bacterium]